MSEMQNCRIATEYFIQKKYKIFLKNNNLEVLSHDQILEFIHDLLNNKNKEGIPYIIKKVREMDDSVSEIKLMTLITDILEDEELIINRISLEIDNFQKSSKMKLLYLSKKCKRNK